MEGAQLFAVAAANIHCSITVISSDDCVAFEQKRMNFLRFS